MAIFRKFIAALKKGLDVFPPPKSDWIKTRSKTARKTRTKAKIKVKKAKPRPKRVLRLVKKLRPQIKIRPLPKKALKPPPKAPKEKDQGIPVGEVTHFFSKIVVCVIKITGSTIAVGDKLLIRGKKTRIVQTVKSLQIENSEVQIARKGALVGLKIDKKARAGDKVFKLAH